jgi:hypothetical protein
MDAGAQSIDGSFRLALEANVLALDQITLSSGSTSVDGAGTTLGLPGSGLGIALGYGASTNVLVGARLLASSTHSKVADAASDTAGFALFPQAEYLFPGAAVRPFISANLGYRATGSSGGVNTSTSTLLIGPGAGLHAFASSGFSVDAGLMALFQKGTSKSDDVALDTSGYSVLLTVALSGWLGGGNAIAAATPTRPPPEKPLVADAGTVAVDEAGAIESTFTLDLPKTSGGVRVTIHGDPDKDSGAVRVIVTSLQAPRPGRHCEVLAFEAGGTRTELSDIQSSSRGGFGSALTTQAGALSVDALSSLTDPDREAWLMLCDERVLLLPAAKHRMERFIRIFRRRLQSAHP